MCVAANRGISSRPMLTFADFIESLRTYPIQKRRMNAWYSRVHKTFSFQSFSVPRGGHFARPCEAIPDYSAVLQSSTYKNVHAYCCVCSTVGHSSSSSSIPGYIPVHSASISRAVAKVGGVWCGPFEIVLKFKNFACLHDDRVSVADGLEKRNVFWLLAAFLCCSPCARNSFSTFPRAKVGGMV